MRSIIRAKGMVSRTWWRPQIQATVRSTPRPKPACGTEPYWRRSRYQSKASSGSLCSLDALLEHVEVVLALAAADDLAVALGREHVHAQRHLRVVRIVLEVEGLHVGRVAVDDDRPVELVGEDRLLVAAEVVAPLGSGGRPSAAARWPRCR